MKQILESSIYTPLGRINRNEEREQISSFINHMLWYDNVILPTSDFEELIKIYNWFGDTAFQKLIERELISFTKFHGVLAYFTETSKGESNSFLTRIWGIKEQGHLEGAEPAEAIEAQLTKGTKYSKQTIQKFTDVLSAKVSIYQDKIINYNNIFSELLTNPDLRKTFKIKKEEVLKLFENQEKDGIWFTLGESDENEFEKASLVKKIISLGYTKDLLLSGSQQDNCDLVFDDIMTNYIGNEFNQVSSQTINKKVQELFQLVKLKTIPELIADKSIEYSDLIDFRDSSACKDFRKWLHGIKKDNVGNEENELIENYLKTVKKEAKSDKLISKILRVGIATGLGTAAGTAVNPGMGTVVGAATGFAASLTDSIVIDRVLKGWNPKIFFAEYHRYLEKK